MADNSGKNTAKDAEKNAAAKDDKQAGTQAAIGNERQNLQQDPTAEQRTTRRAEDASVEAVLGKAATEDAGSIRTTGRGTMLSDEDLEASGVIVVDGSKSAEEQQAEFKQALAESGGGPDVEVKINPSIHAKLVVVPSFLGGRDREFTNRRGANFLSAQEWEQFRNSPVNRNRDGLPVLVKAGER